MTSQERDESGCFTFKSDTHRTVRSIRTTDKTWEVLGSVASGRGITRADLLEYIVDSGRLEGLFPEIIGIEEMKSKILKEAIEDIESGVPTTTIKTGEVGDWLKSILGEGEDDE